MACEERDEAGCVVDTESSRKSTGEDEQEMRPSLICLTFLRKATAPANVSSIDLCSWRRGIYDGVLFENNTKRFWVDEKLHKNCLAVFPKAMDIAGAEDQDNDCWKWIDVKVKCFGDMVDIKMPELGKLSWLQIKGTVRTTGLSPKTTYEVSLVVRLSEACNSWPIPVNFRVNVPDGRSFGGPHNIAKKPKGRWINLVAGEFVTDSKNVGEIGYYLHEKCQIYKSGFLVQGLLLQPKD